MEYIRHNRAWYAEANPPLGEWTDEVMLLVDGSAEVMIRWYGNVRGIGKSPKIEAFNDGWGGLFFTWAPILGLLINRDMTADEFEEFITKAGVNDVTPTVSPYES